MSFDLIRLGKFLKDRHSTSTVAELVHRFPSSDNPAAERIDRFVARAVGIAYKNPKGAEDRAGAALLASVLLTSLEPRRFVDFRSGNWQELAELLHYPLPDDVSYGDKVVQAGRFAQAVTRTKTFRACWPDQEPLWTLAGICWLGKTPEKPSSEDQPPDDFPDVGVREGKRKERLHLFHERNQRVVRRAKQLAWQLDNELPCQACGFSFVRVYGELGNDFIEAHHKKQIAFLNRGDRTKVEDIALVCANCHRMLHRGDRTLSIEELKNMLRTTAAQ